MCRGSETQLQEDENLNTSITAGKGFAVHVCQLLVFIEIHLMTIGACRVLTLTTGTIFHCRHSAGIYSGIRLFIPAQRWY